MFELEPLTTGWKCGQHDPELELFAEDGMDIDARLEKLERENR